MIDIEGLLKPISPDHPAGPDLRLAAGDLTFRRLAEYRRESDAAVDAGGEARAADWKSVVQESAKALRERSKDLELAATLTQGLVGTDGFAGLAAGLRLVRGLIDRYWETLHPGYDEGEIVLPIRARPLAWLGTSRDFLTAVKRVPLAGAPGAPARSWLDYEQSRRVDEAGTRSDQQAFRELLEAGLVTGEQWQAALVATPPAQLGATVAALRAGLAELEALVAACAGKFGDDAPAMIELRNLLGDCLGRLENVMGGETAVAARDGAGPPAQGVAGAAPASGAGNPAGAGGPITSREQAYRQLREVAEFLRRVEPHSPVALLIDRAVKWGGMPFPALLQDVVKSQEARAQIIELLGLAQEDQG
jgi:type VI secretion system protein ImpA